MMVVLEPRPTPVRKHPDGHGNVVGMHHHRILFNKYCFPCRRCLGLPYRYFKVLGTSVLPSNQPLVVKAKLVSKIVEKKIKEGNGGVVLTA